MCLQPSVDITIKVVSCKRTRNMLLRNFPNYLCLSNKAWNGDQRLVLLRDWSFGFGQQVTKTQGWLRHWGEEICGLSYSPNFYRETSYSSVPRSQELIVSCCKCRSDYAPRGSCPCEMPELLAFWLVSFRWKGWHQKQFFPINSNNNFTVTCNRNAKGQTCN